MSELRKITSAEDLEEVIAHTANEFFLDVREPAEIAELGSMKGYVNIPLGELERRIHEVPRDKTILTA
ncbi:MAG: hypothetical protein FJW30_04540 [Acidobacteria bacterium]|nr:hypothetical protein [Acidobacteriota bacterium]